MSGDAGHFAEWITFQPMAWVRLNLSPECPFWQPKDGYLNGRTGHVLRICRTVGTHCDPRIPGRVLENTTDHDGARHSYEVYLVDLDIIRWCAAAELEPLTVEPLAQPPEPGA